MVGQEVLERRIKYLQSQLQNGSFLTIMRRMKEESAWTCMEQEYFF